MLNRLIHALKQLFHAGRAFERWYRGEIHAGKRAVAERRKHQGTVQFRKVFQDTPEGVKAYEQEVMARRLFSDKSWITPIVRIEQRSFWTPFYPADCRLDRAVLGMDDVVRCCVAREAIKVLFDIFLAGYAHRDFHAKNLFWIDGQLRLVDYECIAPYAQGNRPPFPESYDITGQGLESPFRTDRMCYTCPNAPEFTLQRVLRVPVALALEEFCADMKNRLREACRTFATRKQRHTCRADRIYSSFHLPYLSVSPNEAQRNSVRRLQDFGIRGDALRGKRVLDLGCNVGGMLFAVQQYGPGYCLGVEYDADKVLLAQQIAAYCGLNNVNFIQEDLDMIDMPRVGAPFDVVLCLAIEAHLKNPKRLFRFLSEAATHTVYFEGNSTTSVEEIMKALRASGFQKVTFLGMSRDDVLPENNCRPLVVAMKQRISPDDAQVSVKNCIRAD